MTEKEERPYAHFYDQGHTAGLAGVPVEKCPYVAVGGDRREQLARRWAWLEGHSDGLSQRRQEVKAVRGLEEPVIPRAAPGTLTPSLVARRYQRRRLRAAGHPERYVDRRLRQLAAEALELTRGRRVSSESTS